MPSAKSIIVFLAAAATPLVSAADFWAMFCDDPFCTIGCGESVQVSNPGCLDESGRGSVLFHGADVGSGDYSLVISDSADCPCQSDCQEVPSGSTCWDISTLSTANSFRFISGTCDVNNC
ncbi:hypothetical protein GGR57DRAFT_365566 [Xylariaceae sp. FL1272]|nr:hypothetical protein GGR57DRAFT_365566 [Xylariaceae sp. FL1272]